MLRLATACLVCALVAAVFGFGVVASITYDAGRLLFAVFLTVTLAALALGARHRPVDYF